MGHNSAKTVLKLMVLFLCTLSIMLYISAKFCEIILKGFRVMEWTYVMGRNADRQMMGKQCFSCGVRRGGGETKYTMFDLSSVCQFFYKFLTSELVHPYHLDEVISSSW